MSLSKFLKEIIQLLSKKGIENPVSDAEIIIAHVLEVDRYKLIIDNERVLTDNEISKIKKLTNRRSKFEPIAYITGHKEFYSLDFNVNKNVLIPRPETELLVDMAIYYTGLNGKALDIGTGAGAIAIALKHNRPDVDVFATDVSQRAIQVARKNSREIIGKNKIKFLNGDLFEPLKEMKFNVIISNPPYINPDISNTPQADLKYEPDMALYSKKKGTEIFISSLIA